MADDKKIHTATHHSILEIAGIKLRCYITEDGKRIIDCDDVHDFFEALAGDADISPEGRRGIAYGGLKADGDGKSSST